MRITFAGSEFEQLAGFTKQVDNYYDLLPPDFADATIVFHRTIRETPCGAFVGDIITSASGARYLHETVHLPLCDTDKTIRFLLVYGVGKKPVGDDSPREWDELQTSHIKELHYLDLGAGAPKVGVKNFQFYK